MKTRTDIIVTAHPTQRGEIIDTSAFPQLVEQLNTFYIPVDIEHDPRMPPVGRVCGARLVTLADGTPAIEATTEIFSETDGPNTPLAKRELYVEGPALNTIRVAHDENYRDPESQEDIAQLTSLLKADAPRYGSKNSRDPITILTIAASFALCGMAAGFLNQLGADAYEAAKRKVLGLLRRARKKHSNNLLCFDITVTHSHRRVLIRFILTDPTEKAFDAVVKKGMPLVERKIEAFLNAGQPVAQLVFEGDENTLRLKYGVRRDGIPLRPKNSLQIDLQEQQPPAPRTRSLERQDEP